jgi:hypothetical protein
LKKQRPNNSLDGELFRPSLGISKGVVTKYVGLAVAAALNWATIAPMDEATLERRLLACARPSERYAQV